MAKVLNDVDAMLKQKERQRQKKNKKQDKDAKMEIYIVGNVKKMIMLHVNQNDTIKRIKKLIEKQIGIAAQKQSLTFNGNKLLNLVALSQYNIKPKSVLHLRTPISMYVINKINNNTYFYFYCTYSHHIIL